MEQIFRIQIQKCDSFRNVFLEIYQKHNAKQRIDYEDFELTNFDWDDNPKNYE